MTDLGKRCDARDVGVPRVGKDDQGEGDEAEGDVVGKSRDVFVAVDAGRQRVHVKAVAQLGLDNQVGDFRRQREEHHHDDDV